MKELRTLAGTWRLIQDCAASGARCPKNEEMPSGHLPLLARHGKLRIEVSGHNWRTVKILVGPMAGRFTAPDPTGAAPYLVIAEETPKRQLYRDPVDVPEKTTPTRNSQERIIDLPARGRWLGSSGFIRPLTKAELMRGRA